jgi:cytochrome bd ubiquinol oxidase subunit I
LMFSFPFPYIATTFGWMTAELGRQPWLIYGLQRTMHGTSPLVSGGDVVFSMLGFMGLYFVMGVLFLYLIFREVGHGPERRPADPPTRPRNDPEHDTAAAGDLSVSQAGEG